MKKIKLFIISILTAAIGANSANAETIQRVTQTNYDYLNNVVCTATRMNPAVYGALPGDACVLGIEGAYGKDRISKNTYDAAGQLTQVFQAFGTPDQRTYATYSYSANGKVIDTIDANGNRTHNVYDGFDRLSALNYPSTTRAANFDGSSQATALTSANSYNTTDYETYGYDANNNKISWRRRDGNVINYSYDNLNRETITDLPAGVASDVYTNYNNIGGIIYRRFNSYNGAGVNYYYNGLGQLISSTDINGFALSYQYNQAGARTRLTYPDGNYIGYNLDALNRIVSTGWNSNSGLFSQNYNDNGNLLSIGKGSAGSTSYTYDNLNRLSSLSNDLPGTANDISYSFTSYNPANQILSTNSNNSIYEYVETQPSTTNRSFDGLNRNAGIAALSGGYDARGNLTFDGTRHFSYDILNRLYYKNSSDGTVDIALSYDTEGRLTGYNSGGVVTYFLYDGTELVAEYNATGNLLRRYVHSSREDDPQVWLEGSSSTDTRYIFTDYQGSVIATTNTSGSSAQIYKYGGYGEPKDSANNDAWNGFRFRYTGQQILPEAKLYHYKARVYDPNLGTFLQTDPIGAKDDLDLYAYVGGDPVNNVDSTGNFCQPCLAAAGARAGGRYIAAGITTQMDSPVIGPADAVGVGMAVFATGALIWDVGSAILTNKQAPPVPDVPVGENPRPSRNGGRIVSGPLKPEHGGTGDSGADHDVLTGGTSKPNDSGGRPPGTTVGDNGVQHRPGIKGNGPRIDIPGNGTKPPETLHYPPSPKPPTCTAGQKGCS